MTTVKIETKDTIRIEIIGHANYGPSGCDIVCAAVSILSTVLIQRLIEVDAKPYYEYLSGRVIVEYKENEKTIEILNTILCGFRLLTEQYPDNVKIIL